MAKPRQRVFGKAATWMRKRKKASGDPEPSSSSPKLVGWDDVLCRPIYETSRTSLTSSEVSKEGSEASDNEENSPRDVFYQEDESASAESEAPVKIEPFGRPVKRRRVFGSRKTFSGRGSTSARFCMSLAARKRTVQPSAKEDTDSVTDTSDSSVAASESLPIPSESTTDTDVQPSTKKAVAHSEFDFVDDEKKEAPRQPTCTTTNLAEARRFFEELDSSQPLILEESSSSSCREPARPHVRTRRVVSMDNASLRADYQEHCRASRESNVKPLSLQAFIANRSAFFRTDRLYDGFLDE